MIYRAIRLALASILLWALLASSVIAVRRSTSALPRALIDTGCELPCMFTITPGNTTRAEALAALSDITGFSRPAPSGEQLAALYSFALLSPSGEPISGTVIIGSGEVAQLVRLATWRPRGQIDQLGNLLSLGLRPARVYLACPGVQPYYALIMFETQPTLAAGLLPLEALDVHTPVMLLDSSADGDHLPAALTILFPDGCYIPSPWRGFVPLWLYLSP
ncbi:MAG: hypothetical protein SNJ59_09055 [Aggregatilineales bacterium]